MNKLTKFSRAILAIAIMLCVALPTLAHDFEVGGIYYNYLDKTAKTVEVTYKGSYYTSYYNEYTGSVTIPSSVTYSGTTYSVTSIGYGAFYRCSGLTSLTIGNSVTLIGWKAFEDCTVLTEVTIPNSVTLIGNNAFYGCRGLTEVNISDLSTWCKIDFGNYDANPLYYAKKFKLNGIEITDLVIPNDVTEIKNYAFYNCSGLTSITIPNSVISIGNYAFYNCSGLTSITIPNSVTSIGESAFEYCYGLTEVTIPNSVTSIGDGAFYRCSGLTEVNISDLSAWCKIDFESDYANPLCYAHKLKLNGAEIKDLVIPNDVTEIKNYAFYDCTGLTSVTIGNSVTSISYRAFSGCSGLTSITIPNSVTSIGDVAFYDCTGLTSVTIPNSVTSIGDYAFSSCTRLTSITIPNSVTSIGTYAFYGCDGLTSVSIGNSVTSIGAIAFYNCSGLTEVTIGNSVTSIGDKAFYNCWDLRTIISLNPTPPVCSSSESFYDDLYSSATLYVPKDSYAKYFVDEVWGQFTNIKKIEILVSSITLNNSTIELDKGSTATLSATIAPSNATIKNIVWTSSNPQIATVDQSGKVTALSAGTATITAMDNDGSNVSASCQVVVKEVETKITLSQTEANLPVNDVMTLSYEVIPLTTPVEWSTSNENVAYVKTNSDGSATIVGVADGVAIITAKALDGSGVSASCVVTVGISGVEGVEMDNNAVEVSRYDIHGRLLSEPTPGINIVKMSNGTTRKEIVKN